MIILYGVARWSVATVESRFPRASPGPAYGAWRKSVARTFSVVEFRRPRKSEDCLGRRGTLFIAGQLVTVLDGNGASDRPAANIRTKVHRHFARAYREL